MKYRPKKFKLPPSGIWPRQSGWPPYVFNDDIAVAVDVALATNRPLLVSGPPGSGKSMLAPAMAGVLERRFLNYTFTSRSRLEDLTGQVDQLRRLNDANARRLLPDWTYVEPGLLWWTFQPETAVNRGATEKENTDLEEEHPHFLRATPPIPLDQTRDAVILLDEIDKAEPDLPNDLLDPLDRRCFRVPNGSPVQAPPSLALLTIITTNGERDLPPAFLRRCVILRLSHPSAAVLQTIGERHFPKVPAALQKPLADKVVALREQARAEDRRPPSTSEFLDAVQACDELEITTTHKLWPHVEQATLLKNIDPNEHASQPG